MERKISEQKKRIVKEFVELLEKYPIVAAINMENLPAKQLQNMRAKLRSKAVLRMTKRRLIIKALEEVEEKKKNGIIKLKDYLKGMPALLFTSENPFSLFKFLKQNKSKAPIKAGQIAPNDIVVPAGPTGFAPGPIISELAQFGIKAGVENGKVAVKQDSIVAKEGDVVDGKLATLLTRLGIEPMEIGLDLTAVFEEGEIITKDILDIDEEAYINNIKEAAIAAINLSFNAVIPTTDTIELLIKDAAIKAKALSLEAGIITKDNIKDLIIKANSGLFAIVNKLPENALSDELKSLNSNLTNNSSEALNKSDSDNSVKEDTKKEESKQDAAAGLGALFG